MKVRVGIFLKILDDWTNHLSHLIIPTVGASYQPRSPLVIWTPTEASSREEQKQHFYQGKLSVLFFALPSMKYTPQFWYNSYLSSIYANLLRTCRCWFQTNRQVVASISQKGAMWFNLTRSPSWSDFLLQTQQVWFQQSVNVIPLRAIAQHGKEGSPTCYTLGYCKNRYFCIIQYTAAFGLVTASW